MRNPWLGIPYADYVDHMASPNVGQLPLLRLLLAEALAEIRPRSLLFLGACFGNGLEHLDPAVTRHVACVDLNPEYLERLRFRFPEPPFRLDTSCADVQTMEFPCATFDMIHAALLFEYLAWPPLLPRLAAALCPQGSLSLVLQLPSATIAAVTPSAFASLRQLESQFRFVDPDELIARAAEARLSLQMRRTESLPTGKAFEVLRFAPVAL